MWAPTAIPFASSSWRSLQSRRTDQALSAGNIPQVKEISMSIQADLDIGTIAALGPLGAPPSTKYERLIAKAKQVPAATTLVVHPCDETALRGPLEAAGAGIIDPVLVGPAAKISAVAREHHIDVSRFEIIDVPHSEEAAARCVALIREGKGELLM